MSFKRCGALIETMLEFCEDYKKIPELNIIPQCGNLPQTDSFYRSLGNSPENLWKLSTEGKSPHQEIRRNYGTLRSRSYFCYYLFVSFIQRRLKFFNKKCLI